MIQKILQKVSKTFCSNVPETFRPNITEMFCPEVTETFLSYVTETFCPNVTKTFCQNVSQYWLYDFFYVLETWNSLLDLCQCKKVCQRRMFWGGTAVYKIIIWNIYANCIFNTLIYINCLFELFVSGFV